MPHDPACSDPACGCGHDHGATGPRPPVAPAPQPWRPVDHVRVLALGVFRRDDRILCAPVHDDDGTIIGWRPLGGAVEFGETAAAALTREMHAETGQAITDIRTLGVLENLFTHQGAPGHEIAFVLAARFEQPKIYHADALAFSEAGHPGEAKWISPAKARAGRVRLFPDGLADLLAE